MAHDGALPSPRPSRAGGGLLDGLRSPGNRALAVAAALYLALTALYLTVAPSARLAAHTSANHYALTAEAWLHGRLDLGGPPPRYTGNNDFARFEGKWFVSFPPVPAALLLPVVAATGSSERVRDGLFFLWFAALAPSALYLVFDKLRRGGRSGRKPWHDVGLSVLFALGTVYWFSAEQGSVWFAGHVVATGFACLYVLASLDAAHPAWAGLALALAAGTRPTLLFAMPFFVFELGRVPRTARWRKLASFALPLAAVLALLAWHNAARFGDPFEFGHRHLDIVWRRRIDAWGLFSWHYLGRNLGVVLSGLPFFSAELGLQINAHGLALWITSPFFAWALWPRRTPDVFRAAAVSAALVALPNLLYQNTGWIQFGYRFSNDFAPFLMVLVGVGGRRLRAPFWACGALAVVVNAFGAITFGRPEHARRYFVDRTQKVLHQTDP